MTARPGAMSSNDDLRLAGLPAGVQLRSVRLYGLPCGECGQPASGMAWAAGWRRIYHVAGWFCEIGTPPTGARGSS